MKLLPDLALGQVEETSSGCHLNGENCLVLVSSIDHQLKLHKAALSFSSIGTSHLNYLNYVWPWHFVALRQFKEMVEALLNVLRSVGISPERFEHVRFLFTAAKLNVFEEVGRRLVHEHLVLARRREEQPEEPEMRMRHDEAIQHQAVDVFLA
jgi:hypothetical protein